MYNWQTDALAYPWKVRCPHFQQRFPTNDFQAFYNSGLDARGIFDPSLANRALLYNLKHPDKHDPLHPFSVDDGEGYFEGDHRWRFIGDCLIRGQWKQLVLGGIVNLSAAYLATGDPAYAHKAGVLLDRVADLYPTFDFGQQGVLYETEADTGYVSTWHDACRETRELALAYDRVSPALQDVALGFAKLDFAPQARPVGQEGIAENAEQLFALCIDAGINHLIYAGFAINWCLLMSPGGMLDMSRRGLMCSVLRQAVTAVENRETARLELGKQLALWRVSLAFGFVFDVDDFAGSISICP
jgi:hypothetical protein